MDGISLHFEEKDVEDVEEEEEGGIEAEVAEVKFSLHILMVKLSKVDITLQWNITFLARNKRIKLLNLGTNVVL